MQAFFCIQARLFEDFLGKNQIITTYYKIFQIYSCNNFVVMVHLMSNKKKGFLCEKSL